MTASKAVDQVLPEQVAQDAEEFGRHAGQYGWRLGFLVARNVQAGVGVGGNASVVRTTDEGKVSATAFGKRAGVSTDKVLLYLKAWERAAEEGKVPAADTLRPGVDLHRVWELLPEWRRYYAPRQHDSASRLSQSAIIQKIAADPKMAEAARRGLELREAADSRVPQLAKTTALESSRGDISGARSSSAPTVVTAGIEEVDADDQHSLSAVVERTEVLLEGCKLIAKGLAKIETVAPLADHEQADLYEQVQRALRLLPGEVSV